MLHVPEKEILLNIGHPRNKQAFVQTPLHKAHIEHLIDYFKDPELTEVMGWSFDPAAKDTHQFIKAITDCCHPACQSDNHLIFGEFQAPDTLPIGYQAVKGINLELGVAEYGNATLDPVYRSRGYGRTAMRTILRYLFDELGMKKIHGTVLESNQAQLNMTKKTGWQLVEITSWEMPDGTLEPMHVIQITAEDLIR
ncbi:MAG: N-acetyltransferase [Candidatus Electrothrix sp. AW2]|jgi:RimJ/RimL family protein N-acetyltransferase|nr:N-acetyltransferase [Candidatus Electrothrix gigas]